MKKLICLFMFITACLFLSIDSYAATWKFQWENTTVRIPVGDSIEKYRNIPEAKLLKDGIVLTDAAITYNTEGDWLYYFKDIDPYTVGEYYVWYKAYDAKYSPGTCTGYKSLINFIVEDTIAPTVEIVNDTVSIHRGSEYNLSSNVIAKDNYKVETVSFIESIDVNKVGTYEVTAVVVDSSGNKTTKKFNVLVYENSKPVITCSNRNVSIPVGAKFDFSTIFQASDNVDGDISNRIEYPSFNTSILGDYKYTVSVTNLAGVREEYTIDVAVVDDEEPVLELNSHSVMVDYQQDFSKYNFKKHIKKLSDNTTINYDNLTIDYDIYNEVGSYTVTYTYTDGIYTVSDELTMVLVSYDKPKVESLDIELNKGDVIDLLDYISVTDPSDPNILDSVEIDDSKIDYTKEGTYYADVVCVNSSGLSTTAKVKVVIKSDSSISVSSLENLPLIIIAGLSSVVAICLFMFIVFYFIFKKKLR